MRPIVSYYGGKSKLVQWLAQYVPPGGRPYCEPYCGAASLFFCRSPAPVEILNDRCDRIVSLFRALRDPDTARELERRLQLTLYSRSEWRLARQMVDDTSLPLVDRAWATYVLYNQGFAGHHGGWGYVVTHSTSNIAQTTAKWLSRLDWLPRFAARLRVAQIECADALELIPRVDGPDAVFYVDPPYVFGPRRSKSAKYRCDVDEEHHRRLVEILIHCQGSVTLSGYPHPVYEPLERAGWKRIEREVSCHAAGRTRGTGLKGNGAVRRAGQTRIEAVWLNPRCQEMLSQASLLAT